MNFLNNEKILIFLYSLEIGGAEKQAAMLANFLMEHGAKVVIFTYSKNGPLEQILNKDIIIKQIDSRELIDRGKFAKIYYLLKLIFKFRKVSPSIIIPFTYYPNLDCCLAWRFTNTKVCFWNQRDLFPFKNNALEKISLKKSSKIIVNSENSREFLIKYLNSVNLNDRIKFIIKIPNGVDIQKKIKLIDYRNKLKIGKESFICVMTANFTKFKDHLTLLYAWHNFIKKNKFKERPILILSGRFDIKCSETLLQIDNLGIQDYIIIINEFKYIKDLLASSDLGILSSNLESSPNSVLEYMSVGLPVVATDNPGTREVLGEKYPFLTKKSDFQDLCNKIMLFYKDKHLRERIGRKNMKRAVRYYSKEKMLREFVKQIKDLI